MATTPSRDASRQAWGQIQAPSPISYDPETRSPHLCEEEMRKDRYSQTRSLPHAQWTAPLPSDTVKLKGRGGTELYFESPNDQHTEGTQ